MPKLKNAGRQLTLGAGVAASFIYRGQSAMERIEDIINANPKRPNESPGAYKARIWDLIPGKPRTLRDLAWADIRTGICRFLGLSACVAIIAYWVWPYLSAYPICLAHWFMYVTVIHTLIMAVPPRNRWYRKLYFFG